MFQNIHYRVELGKTENCPEVMGSVLSRHDSIATLEGHTNSVMCLAIHKNKLYSGSMDKTIRIWNTEAPHT